MLSDEVRSPYPDAWYTPGVVSQTPLFSVTRSLPGVVATRLAAASTCKTGFEDGTPPMTPSTTGIWRASACEHRALRTERIVNLDNIVGQPPQVDKPRRHPMWQTCHLILCSGRASQHRKNRLPVSHMQCSALRQGPARSSVHEHVARALAEMYYRVGVRYDSVYWQRTYLRMASASLRTARQNFYLDMPYDFCGPVQMPQCFAQHTRMVRAIRDRSLGDWYARILSVLGWRHSVGHFAHTSHCL